MIEQEWVMRDSKRICAVIEYHKNIKHRMGIIFLPGFSQTKAGGYFLFSQICASLNPDIATLRFDYIGYGDSEGEMVDIDLLSMIQDAWYMTKWFAKKTSYKQLVYVGHGIGNYVAATISRGVLESKSILIAPQMRALIHNPRYNNIINEIVKLRDVFDTSMIGTWDENVDDFFAELGGRMNRSKGIVVNKRFLMQIVKFDLCQQCGMNTGIYIFLKSTEGIINNFLYNIMDFRIEDNLLLDMLEREIVIGKVCELCNSLLLMK